MNQEIEQCCNDPWISCLEYKALNRKLLGLEKEQPLPDSIITSTIKSNYFTFNISVLQTSVTWLV